MANIASLLKARLATPERILYRHFAEGERIALCLKNGIHWVAADQGALGLGLVVVPLYVDDNPENVAWCLENSGARLLVVESSRIAVALARASTAVPRVLCLAADPGSGYEPLDAVLPRQALEFEVVPLEDGALATIC